MHALHAWSSNDPWYLDAPERVLEQAQALQVTTARGGSAYGAALRGRHLGLVCGDAGQPAARLFHAAAEALGARVSDIAPLRTDPADGDADTMRLLGRLYDALECQGMEPSAVARLRSLAGIPVFSGLATDTHPSAELTRRLDGADADRRRAVLQAVLMRVLS